MVARKITYRLSDLGKMVVGGDKPAIFSTIKTIKCSVPIYSNGLDHAGLYGYTNKARINEKCLTISARGTVGAVFYRTEPFFPIVRLIAFLPNNEIVDSKYLYYLLSISHLEGFGTSQQQITVPYLSRVKITIESSLPLQRRIASILSAYDNLIEANSRRIKILEQMAENLYKEWFVRFRFPNYQNTPIENGIPKGWKVEKLKEIINLYDSKRIPLSSLERDQQHKIYPYYGAAEIMDYVEDYIFDGRYLLMGEDGSVITPEGFPILQLASGKFWVNNHAHVMQGKDGFSIEYLYLLFKKMNITGIVTGSAQPKISQGRLINKNVLVPAKELRRIFDKQVAPIFSQINTLQLQSANLTRQRDLLLPRLMSGQLTPLTNQ